MKLNFKTLFLKIILIFVFFINVVCHADELSWHFKPSDVNSLHSEPANHRIFYGNDSLQFGDLYLPKNAKKPYPVIILIHGGCWMSHFADIKNTAPLSDALRDHGIAVWNIEYRRIDNPGGGWPGTFKDAANAADYLKIISQKYNLDLNNIIVIGQSAGGHLALWLAARHNLSKKSELYVANPLKVNGVISMGGVPDLKGFREQGIETCDSDVIWNLFGKKDHYKEASPIELLPIHIPQVLLYGEEEQAVPKKFAKQYQKKALRAGDHVKIITIKYAAHHEYNVPNSVVWPILRENISNMLNLENN